VYLATLIREAYRSDSIVTAYVYGPMGHGKTSYALWTAYAVLGSWDRVLDYLFFSLEEAVDAMWRHVSRGRRMPIMILDDAGFYLNRLTWWERDKVMFMEVINLARNIAAGIIFTAPSQEVPRQILNKVNYRVQVSPLWEEDSESARDVLEVAREYGIEEGGVAVAKGYLLTILPSFKKIVRKDYLDYYPLWYPVYREYQRIRLRHMRRKLGELYRRRREERESLLREAVELYLREREPRRVVRFLIDKGLPESTAWYWAYRRIPRLVQRGQLGST
jgi:hypothetical protein